MSARIGLIILGNALGWLAVYLVCGLGIRGLMGMALYTLLYFIAIYDLKYYLIPNGVIVLFLCLGFLWLFVSGDTRWGSRLLGFAAALALALLISLVSKGGLGGGDVKLLAVMGFWSGFPEFFYVFAVSFFLGGLVSLAGILLGRLKRTDRIAFGPYLAAGFMLMFLFPPG